MKVKCVQNTYIEKHLLKANETKTIEGLTLGKEYEVLAASLVEGSIMSGIGSVETRVRFVLFNDNGDWDTYQPELFTPRAE